MKKKTVLITGSSGHLGSQLASLLSPTMRVMTLSKSDKKATICADINTLSQADVERIYENNAIDAVIHCAGITNPKTEEEISFNAYSFTKFLVRKKIRHILIGSVSEYGLLETKTASEKTAEHPSTRYGVSKLLQKQVASYFHRAHQTDIVYLRVSNILMPYGRPDSLIESLFRASEKPNIDIHISTQKTSRDFIDMRDLFSAVQKAILVPTHDFLYNLCSGKQVTYGSLIDHFRKEWAKQRKEPFPTIVYTGVPEICYTGRYTIHKIKKDLGWKPRFSLPESLRWLIQQRYG